MRLEFADCYEGACLPSGQYVVGRKDGMVSTDLGLMPVPNGDSLRYVRLTDINGRKMAGAGQNGSGVWEWTQAAGWAHRGTCFGNAPLIYDAAGELQINQVGGRPTGYAYVEDGTGRIVLADDAYSGPPLWCYTRTGPFTIGQNEFDGIGIDLAGTRYLLEPGDTQMVVAKCSGETLAVATRKLRQNCTVLIWMAAQDVPLLPLVPRGPVVPPVIPPVVDPPVVVPPKEPTVNVPNRFDIVQAVWNRGGWNLATKEGCGQFTEAVAVALHEVDAEFGHLKKHGAQNQFNGHAVDSVLHKSAGWSVDIIVNSESDNAKAGWGLDEIPRYSADDWYTPEGVTPPDIPPVVDDGLAARVKSLEAECGRVLSELAAAKVEAAATRTKVGELAGAIVEIGKAHPVDLSGYAKKGDPVTVTGKIDIGFISRPVVGHGIIDK